MADTKPTAAGTAAPTQRQDPQPRPYGNPRPADLKDVPTVDEIHAKLPTGLPGASETPEQYEKRQKDAAQAQLHPKQFPGLHRETAGGPLVPDDKDDPGINLNVIS